MQLLSYTCNCYVKALPDMEIYGNGAVLQLEMTADHGRSLVKQSIVV